MGQAEKRLQWNRDMFSGEVTLAATEANSHEPRQKQSGLFYLFDDQVKLRAWNREDA